MRGLQNLDESCDPACRICFETDRDLLIQTCKCMGTLAYSHDTCLRQWIILKFPKLKDAICEICKEPYNFQVSTKKTWQKISDEDKKCKFYVYLSILIFFMAVLVMTTIVAFVSYVDFSRKFVYSILIIISCFLPMLLNICLLLKLIISNHLVTEIVSWTIETKD